MTIKQFVEKAIEGGYEATGGMMMILRDQDPQSHRDVINELVLDPEAWKAVGKTEGWGKTMFDGKEWQCGRDGYLNVWQDNMHQMIDALCEGKSIEDFLKTL